MVNPTAPDSDLSRRKFLATLATGAVVAPLAPTLATAAEEKAASAATAQASVSADTLASAEQLAGIQFTPAQREPLLKTVAERATGYPALRTPALPNSVFPVVTFDPRLSGVFPPTGNVVRHGSTWNAPSTSSTTPPTDEELAFSSVAQLAALLRAKRITSRRLTELSLARLKKFDGALFAVVNLTAERALRQADAADAEIAAGKWRGPLHGIPWGAKDLLAVRDYPTTWGAAPFKEQRFDYDAEVVQRLDAAGAVLVAKLTLGALASGDNWFGGQTKCPWNLATGSSGSSAGPCAAVSAGLVPFAIGSETLGSIVSPCTRNAVTGLRPTYGRVSRAGAMTLAWSMDKLGPIARTAEDCAFIFDAIHGADTADPTALDVAFPWPFAATVSSTGSGTPIRTATPLAGQKIGFLAAQFEQRNEWFDTNQATLETLRKLGAELVPLTLPEAPFATLRAILHVEAATAFDDFTLSGGVDDIITPRPSHWSTSLRAARYVPAVEYLQANRLRTLLVRDLEKLLVDAGVDVWLSVPGGNQLTLTNLTGHPLVCVPSGFAPVAGQPSESPRRTAASVSFNARLYRDDRALAVAHAFQLATDWHRRRPPIA